MWRRPSRLPSLLEFIEELLVNVKGGARCEPQLQLLKHLDEFVPVNKFNRRRAVPAGLASCVLGKGAGGEDDALVGAAEHGASEVTDNRSTDTVFVPFALEQNLECDEGIHLENPFAIDSVVSGTTSDGDNE